MSLRERSSVRAGASNRLLGMLSSWTYSAIENEVRPRTLETGETLHSVHEPAAEAVFPVSGVVSLTAMDSDGRSVPVSFVGGEGGIGMGLVVGLGRSPWQAVVRAPGEARSMPAELFRSLLRDEPDFRKQMVAYARMQFDRGADAIACRRLHDLRARAARWLVEIDGRSEEGLVPTPELLAALIDASASELRKHLDALTAAGLIDAQAIDVVRVLDRAGLRIAACACLASQTTVSPLT